MSIPSPDHDDDGLPAALNYASPGQGEPWASRHRLAAFLLGTFTVACGVVCLLVVVGILLGDSSITEFADWATQRVGLNLNVHLAALFVYLLLYGVGLLALLLAGSRNRKLRKVGTFTAFLGGGLFVWAICARWPQLRNRWVVLIVMAISLLTPSLALEARRRVMDDAMPRRLLMAAAVSGVSLAFALGAMRLWREVFIYGTAAYPVFLP